MASLARPRSVEQGLTTRENMRMAGPMIAAALSGFARTMRFGRSSPKRSITELMMRVPATSPIVSAHGANAGQCANQEANPSAADETRATPAITQVRVSQNWTSPRNLPGCSAITRAAPAPSLPDSAIRRSLTFRAETNAVSAAVMRPLATMRKPRITNSYAAYGMEWIVWWQVRGPMQPRVDGPKGAAKRLALARVAPSWCGHAGSQGSP